MTTQWTFHNLRTHYERTTPLALYWEVHCDPISDDYYISEITPQDLWHEWIRRYPTDPHAEAIFGPGAVSIGWYVDGDATFESAPYQDRRPLNLALQKHGIGPDEKHFLTYYSQPLNARTGKPVQWAALPVTDKIWRETRIPKGPHASKGGFIQEATGWKPSPFQPFVNVELLAQASGLSRPSAHKAASLDQNGAVT